MQVQECEDECECTKISNEILNKKEASASFLYINK